jgi:hypothetical protein
LQKHRAGDMFGFTQFRNTPFRIMNDASHI